MTQLEFILKMLFGFLLMLLMAAIAIVIAIGKVEQTTSYGLQDILGGLLVLTGSFAHWAFQVVPTLKQGQPEEEKEEEPQARATTKGQL